MGPYDLMSRFWALAKKSDVTVWEDKKIVV